MSQNIFSEALNYAMGVVEEVAGNVGVTYQHRSTVISNLTAIPTIVEGIETQTGGRTRVANSTVVWVMEAAKLQVNGQLVKPERGAVLTDITGRRYRVAAPNQGKAWKWAHGYDGHIEIQTVDIGPLIATLTVDSTTITADSTTVTADQITAE